MHVKDVGCPAHALAGLDHHAREAGEAHSIALVSGVDPFLVKEPRAVHQPHVDVAVRKAHGGERPAQGLPAESRFHALRVAVRLQRVLACTQAAVERQEDPQVMAAAIELTRQSGRDVGQPSGLGEGGNLGAGQADLHRGRSRGRGARRVAWVRQPIRHRSPVQLPLAELTRSAGRVMASFMDAGYSHAPDDQRRLRCAVRNGHHAALRARRSGPSGSSFGSHLPGTRVEAAA